MSDKLNIEQLFQSRLDGAELSPSPESWKAIQRKLRWKQFLRFKPGQFNIYYAGALLLAATGLAVILAGDKDQADPAANEEPGITLSQSEPSADERTGKALNQANSDSRKQEKEAEASGILSQTEADSSI